MKKFSNPINAFMLFVAAGVILIAVLVNMMPSEQPPIQPAVSFKNESYELASFNPTEEITPRQFVSVEEFSNFVNDYKTVYNYRGNVMLDSLVPEVAMPVAAQGAGETKSLDYSKTNVQVASVDEADIIKTDGNYIYTISGDNVFIIKAYPGEDAEIVATIKYENENPTGLFIHKNKLAVFGGFYDRAYFDTIGVLPNNMIFFDIYDVKDRAKPNKVKEYKFEGHYLTARMTDAYVYLVLDNRFNPRPVYPTPIIIEDGIPKSMPIANIFYFPIPYKQPSLVTVHSIDMTTNENIESKSVTVEGGTTLYMSTDNIYLAYTEYVNEYDLRNDIMKNLLEPRLTSADKELIQKIKDVPNSILSQQEKKNKILEVYMKHYFYMKQDEQDELNEEVEQMLEKKLKEYEHFEFTVVHKLSADNGAIEIKNTGKVPGHVNNQFSMDENRNVFRIATTVSPRWSWHWKDRSESVNMVYALDSSMNTIGKLEDLAEGEQIYSTRFMGDRLYMVTFKQVDPFFVIDLSDPANPKSLGKLKIPGFSRYLHPYDENMIIGIGRNATEHGIIRGLKISLFDVSDPANPIETASYVSNEKYSQSSAEYEHHAFLFSKEKELLVIPVYSYDWKANDGYNGAFVFKIKKDSITLRGLIDHSGTGATSHWSPSIERSLYIEELLYTKSPKLLRINKIEDLSSVKNITLSSSEIPVF